MAKTSTNHTIEAFSDWGELSGIGLNIYNPSGHLKTSFDLSLTEARQLAINLLQACEKHEFMDKIADSHDDVPF